MIPILSSLQRRQFWQGGIHYHNGILTRTNFNSTEVTTSTSDSGTTIWFNNVTKTIQLTIGADLDSYEVWVDCHGEPSPYDASIFTALEQTEAKAKAGTITFRIWPNPASDRLSIQFNSNGENDVEVQIFNGSGQLVLQLPFLETDRRRMQVDVSRLPTGPYYLAVRNRESLFLKTFIKR